MPVRIQRKRTKGWRMPEGAVYVGRPGRWGNPFVVSERVPLPLALDLFSDLLRGFFSPSKLSHLSDADFDQVYRLQEEWRRGRNVLSEAQRFLRGKDLACWCPLDRSCHADIYLELANRDV